MSRRKKRKTSIETQYPTPTAPPFAATPPPPTTETDRRQDRQISFSFVVSCLAFLVSLPSLYYSCSSAQSAKRSADEAKAANELAKASQDRATGRVQARFEFVEEKADRNRYKDFLIKKDGFEEPVFWVAGAEQMLRWGPSVRLRNTGTEPIDAIKVSVNYEFSAAYGKGVQQIYPPPIIFSEEGSHEFTTFGKLMPGQTAKINIAPLLAAQVSRAKWTEYSDKDQNGFFTASVHCRLVGASSYDSLNENQKMVFHFHWSPTGFKSDAKGMKELLEIKPWIKIE